MKSTPFILCLQFFLVLSLSFVGAQSLSGELEGTMTLTFSPPSPVSIRVGEELSVRAISSIAGGGIFSIVSADVGTTNGVFSGISELDGEFSFSDSTASGTARIEIKYTSPLGISVTASYFIFVTAELPPMLEFDPPSPSIVLDIEGYLEVQAIGFPEGGSYTFSNAVSGGTKGRFEVINPDYGIFIFTGFEATGEASIDVTYTAPSGASITQTYSITVEAIGAISIPSKK